jgi:hypothetical protein
MNLQLVSDFAFLAIQGRCPLFPMSHLQTHPLRQLLTKLLPSSPSPPTHWHLDCLAKSNGSAAGFGSAPIAQQLLPKSYQRAFLFLLNAGHRL